MAKSPRESSPRPGDQTPLQTSLKSDGSMYDDRMPPCGKNLLANVNDEGERAGY